MYIDYNAYNDSFSHARTIYINYSMLDFDSLIMPVLSLGLLYKYQPGRTLLFEHMLLLGLPVGSNSEPVECRELDDLFLSMVLL